MKLLPNDIAIIEGDTHIGKWVEQSGRLDHDQNTLPHLTNHIPEGGTVIDVGAYIGDHTEFYASQVGPSGKVYAFEPNHEAFECLTHNMQRHANVTGLNHVTCLNVGASDHPHRIGIARSTNGGASHATPEGDIPCITIDSLNLPACHFIKFDCEGMEPAALAGAWRTIQNHRPVMLIEVNPHALHRQGYTTDSIFDLLDHMNYLYTNVYPDQKMEGEQFDILCKPKP